MCLCGCAGFDVFCFASRRLAEALQIDHTVDPFNKSTSSKFTDSLKEDARWFKFKNSARMHQQNKSMAWQYETSWWRHQPFYWNTSVAFLKAVLQFYSPHLSSITCQMLQKDPCSEHRNWDHILLLKWTNSYSLINVWSGKCLKCRIYTQMLNV